MKDSRQENKPNVGSQARLFDRDPDSLVSGKQMCKILSINYFTLASYANQGLISSYKIGRVRRYNPQEVLDEIRSGKLAERLKAIKDKTRRVNAKDKEDAK